MTNPFLIPDDSGTVGTPDRFYGLLQQIERLPDSVFLQFDLIAADWFDINAALVEGQWSKLDTRIKFFGAAPLFALEGNAPAFDWAPILNRMLQNVRNDLAGIISVLEARWVEIELTLESGPSVLLYRNLFGQGEKRNLKSIRPASFRAARMLNATDPLGPEPDATDIDVQNILSKVTVGDFVSVYEVGQGNMNALCDGFGRPQPSSSTILVAAYLVMHEHSRSPSRRRVLPPIHPSYCHIGTWIIGHRQIAIDKLGVVHGSFRDSRL